MGERFRRLLGPELPRLRHHPRVRLHRSPFPVGARSCSWYRITRVEMTVSCSSLFATSLSLLSELNRSFCLGSAPAGNSSRVDSMSRLAFSQLVYQSPCSLSSRSRVGSMLRRLPVTTDPATNVVAGCFHLKQSLECSVHSRPGPHIQGQLWQGPNWLSVSQPRQSEHLAAPASLAGVCSSSAASRQSASRSAHNIFVFTLAIFCSILR